MSTGIMINHISSCLPLTNSYFSEDNNTSLVSVSNLNMSILRRYHGDSCKQNKNCMCVTGGWCLWGGCLRNTVVLLASRARRPQG